MSEFLQSNEF